MDKFLQEYSNDNQTEVYVWGSDHHGQLGLGNKYIGKNYIVPKKWTYNIDIKQISCGENHMVCLTTQGQIYTIGSNKQGKLGINNKTIQQSSYPCRIDDLLQIKLIKVECGTNHSIALSDQGEAYVWGGGEGIGLQGSIYTPQKIETNQRFQDVSCGCKHSMFLNFQREVFCIGFNDEGQLGTLNTYKEISPRKILFFQDEGISQVVCGHYYTLFLTVNGDVYSCGDNSFGQLGIGNKKGTNEIQKVRNLEEQFINKIAASHYSVAINKKGELYIWGTGVFGEYVIPNKFSKIDSSIENVAIGNFFGAAVDINGFLWTWGSNGNGELGVGDCQPRNKPFPVTALKNFRIKEICCGNNYMVAIAEKEIGSGVFGGKLQSGNNKNNEEVEGLQNQLKSNLIFVINFINNYFKYRFRISYIQQKYLN